MQKQIYHVTCPRCGEEFDEREKFCPYCQTLNRKIVCKTCGAQINAKVKRCPACGAPGWGVCRTCRRELVVRPRQVHLQRLPAGFPPVWSGLDYRAPVSQLIIAHKDRQALLLAAVLGELLADVLRRVGDRIEAHSVVTRLPLRTPRSSAA